MFLHTLLHYCININIFVYVPVSTYMYIVWYWLWNFYFNLTFWYIFLLQVRYNLVFGFKLEMEWKNLYLMQSTLQKYYINKNNQHYLTQHTKEKKMYNRILWKENALCPIKLCFYRAFKVQAYSWGCDWYGTLIC